MFSLMELSRRLPRLTGRFDEGGPLSCVNALSGTGLFHAGMTETRQEMALRHVVSGRKIIAAQRRLIERRRGEGKNTTVQEELLARYEHTQSIFEDDLFRLSQRE